MNRTITFLTLAVAFCCAPLAVSAAARPNFIVFIADDLSHFDTEPYGAKDKLLGEPLMPTSKDQSRIGPPS